MPPIAHTALPQWEATAQSVSPVSENITKVLSLLLTERSSVRGSVEQSAHEGVDHWHPEHSENHTPEELVAHSMHS